MEQGRPRGLPGRLLEVAGADPFLLRRRADEGLGGDPGAYRKRYKNDGKEMGRLTFSDVNVQMLGAENAFVRGKFQLVRSKDKPGGLFTLILKRFPEGWRMVHRSPRGDSVRPDPLPLLVLRQALPGAGSAPPVSCSPAPAARH